MFALCSVCTAEEVNALRAVKCAESPVIDGRLDEEAWDAAPELTRLTTVQPTVGKALGERTNVRVMYDDVAIYVGIRAHHRDGSTIMSKGRERDGMLLSGDYVAFFFDTFDDRRNGYAFAVSPDEGRWDASVTNHFNANTDWDGIWQVRCVTDGGGWTAEISIPFKTLNYDSKLEEWGFNFSRNIARTGELAIWNAPRPESKFFYAGNAGRLTGLSELPHKLGFEFSPYALGRVRDRRGDKSNLSGDVGFDTRWRINSGLSATLSYNMDFAETEVDQLRRNFTRFPLFFPEKRRFFQEDSGIYQFADLNQGLLIPYYSRRIGLSQARQPVPILGAAKLAGRAGEYELGVTTAYLDEAFGVDSNAVFSGRLKRRIFGDSTMGFIATAGDPRSNGDNAVVGMDLRFQSINWQDQQTLVTNAFYLNSMTDPVGASEFSGHAYGVGISWPADTFSFSLRAAEVDDFDPALGFISRNDIRTVSGQCQYLIRPEEDAWWQYYSISYSGSLFTNLENERESLYHSVSPLTIRFANNDEFAFSVSKSYDKTEFGYFLTDDVFVDAGGYDMVQYDLRYDLSENRPFSGSIGVNWGDYYGGDQWSAYLSGWWVPSPLIACGIDYSFYTFEMPDGSFDSHVASLWLNLRFTPRMSWSNLIQYDSLSNGVGFNSRFAWEYRDGHQLNLVFNQALYDFAGDWYRDTEAVAKIGMQIRF
jgi:Domain of unknown function (DUF5916)/Carbohydrate family 9 binding domain-like